MTFKGKKKCRFGVVKQPIYFHFGVCYTKTASRFSSNVFVLKICEEVYLFCLIMCPSCIAAKVARQQMIDEYISKGMRFIVKGKRKSKPPQIFHAGVCNITRLCLYTKAEIILTIFMSTIINIQIHNHLSMDRIGSILIVQIIRKNTSAKLSNNAPNLLSASRCLAAMPSAMSVSPAAM